MEMGKTSLSLVLDRTNAPLGGGSIWFSSGGLFLLLLSTVLGVSYLSCFSFVCGGVVA